MDLKRLAVASPYSPVAAAMARSGGRRRRDEAKVMHSHATATATIAKRPPTAPDARVTRPPHIVRPSSRFDFRHPTAQFCVLCREPAAFWPGHERRADHLLLRTHLDAVIACAGRTWPSPHGALAAFERRFGPRAVASAMIVYTHQDGERRKIIHAAARHLRDCHVIRVGPHCAGAAAELTAALGTATPEEGRARAAANAPGSALHGFLVADRLVVAEVARLYPSLSPDDFSHVYGFCMSAYNWETVYDMCAFAALDERYAVSLSHAGPTSPDTDSGSDSNPLAATVASKANTLRGVMAQVRAAVEAWEDKCGSDFYSHTATPVPPYHLDVLGAVLGRAVAAELVMARAAEYVRRAEDVWWRDLGAVTTSTSSVCLSQTEAPPPLSMVSPLFH